ncbi:MAG: signal peptidase I [Alphaproteobacteria bacterium]
MSTVVYLQWLLLLCFLSCFGIFVWHTELGINQTSSIRDRLWVTWKESSFKKNELVTLANHPTSYLPKERFTKRVKGLPGDKIHIQHGKLYLNEKVVGDLFSATSDGRPLTPLKSRVIPPGYIFVMGDHPRSFDSRYQEFGLVSIKHIVGRSIRIW